VHVLTANLVAVSRLALKQEDVTASSSEYGRECGPSDARADDDDFMMLSHDSSSQNVPELHVVAH
jgi:hypothetical protein